MNTCTADALTGSASNCNTACTHTPITTPQGGDLCCPPGANANTDADCMAECGNGAVEAGERCDGNCPMSAASCNDNMVCTSDMLMGTACSRECVHAPLQASTGARDMCCPMGANAATDSDCEAVCGNNVVEMGERCDGNCPATPADCSDDMPCTTDTITGAACSRQCAHAPITAPMAAPDGCCPTGATSANDGDCATRCGNMVMEAGEQCDDGNTTAGDGCSATCQIDNNTMTPGDERRGFVACGVVGTSSTMTCAMDQQCCNTAAMGGTPTYACAASGGTCENRHACDGPEDCGMSEVCCLTTTPADGETTRCAARADCMGTVQVCHTQPSAMCPL
jgi:cysteine-rich repeat protein